VQGLQDPQGQTHEQHDCSPAQFQSLGVTG
jgi:hypothetical protein